MSQLNHQLITRYFETLSAKNWLGFAETMADDVVYVVPQTRETVRGKVGYLDFNQTFPGNWVIEIVRLIADETQAVGQILFRDGDQVWTGIIFFAIAEGKIHQITDFWPEPYEPPPRMTKWVERY